MRKIITIVLQAAIALSLFLFLCRYVAVTENEYQLALSHYYHSGVGNGWDATVAEFKLMLIKFDTMFQNLI